MFMSYRTVEVKLENGRVCASGLETLPEKATALLTILDSQGSEPEQLEGPSLADLMAEYAGIGNGTHTDLSTNKAHLDDIGK
jgi:hypothetical protein